MAQGALFSLLLDFNISIVGCLLSGFLGSLRLRKSNLTPLEKIPRDLNLSYFGFAARLDPMAATKLFRAASVGEEDELDPSPVWLAPASLRMATHWADHCSIRSASVLCT